jgi:hypothetical protein
MLLINKLWRDEAGIVLSAEAVLIGTVGVLGTVVGLSTVSHAVDAELKEVGMAIRSLDQSYGFCGHRGCGAWTAGSSFVQQDVECALADLGVDAEEEGEFIRERFEGFRKHRREFAPDLPGGDEEPKSVPNDLPPAESAPSKGKIRRPL